jgi:hypothetical protein
LGSYGSGHGSVDVIKVNKNLPLSTADSSLGEKCMELIYLAVE